MKAFIGLVICGGLVCITSSAELRIESLTRDGELTWTNSVSNATYRVEWSGSLAGPWYQFSPLTNLDSIVASNTTVSVTVPMFYRVVWTDPPTPQPVGDWLFNGYNAASTLIVTGLVSIPTGYSTNGVSWSFGTVPIGTNTWTLSPCSAGDGLANLWDISLTVLLGGPKCGVEGAFWLDGTLIGDTYSGTWYAEGFWAYPLGQFDARRWPKQERSSQTIFESKFHKALPGLQSQ